MVNAKRMYVGIIAVTFLITGITFVWVVLSGHLPKKVPLRARQVISNHVDYHHTNCNWIQ